MIQSSRLAIALMLASTCVAFSQQAQAVPSFARQTGMACASCHTTAFGPNLTPFGRKFKLDGYTQGDSESGPLSKGVPPIGGMMIGSFTHTDQSQPAQPTSGPSAPKFDSNNNLAMDEVSLFYGGRIYGPVGAFAQFAYDGVGNSVALDNIDLRFARATTLGDYKIAYGVSLNNAPTVQDIWNTAPAWGFPFATSPIAPGPGTSPLLVGALAQHVGGGSFYAMVNDFVYVEAGAYGEFSVEAQKNMGVWTQDNLALNGSAPYWRIALQQAWDQQYLSLGTFGLQADTYVDRTLKATGTNQFTDLGADLTYQYLGSMDHILEFRATYLREHQQLNATRAVGGTAKPNGMLTSLNLNGSYTFQQTYTGAFGFFDISGSADPLLYPGYAGFRPDSQGFVTEFSYVPFGKSAAFTDSFLNLRLALQYVAYTKFDGATRTAGDNNTLFLNAWAAF